MTKHSYALVALNVFLLIAFWVTETTSKRFGAAPDSLDALSWGVASAISRDIYGIDGYLGYAKVLDHLWGNGFTATWRLANISDSENPIDRSFLDILWNVEENNRIIAESLTLTPPDGSETYGGKTLFATPANDVGYIDFISLGFNIFGYQMESLQLVYLLLFSIGVLAYVGLFRHQTAYLALSALLLVAMLMLAGSVIFTGPQNVVQHHNQRFLDTLAILPLISLLASRIDKKNWFDLSLVGVQILMIAMAIHFRSSTGWVLIPLAGAALLLIHAIRPYIRFAAAGYVFDRADSLLSPDLKRSLIVLIGVIFVMRAVAGSLTSPVYATGEVMPHHMFWHNLYIGLSYHPDWVEKMGHRTNGKSRSDDTAWFAGMNRATGTYGVPATYSFNYLGNSFRHWHKSFHELMIKEEFLTTVFSEPRLTLEVYLWYKPVMTLKKYISVIYTSVINISAVAVLSLLALAGYLIYAGSLFRQQLTDCFWITSVVMLGSMAPIFATYPYEGVLGCSAWLLMTWLFLSFPVTYSAIAPRIVAAIRDRSK